ncbi:MAG TPA: response regulator [Acidimicrobiales bacterium]|nr:response regulator [Acidimicrobiales bacterium]
MDDEADFRFMVRTALELAGVKDVHEAADARQAQRLAGELRPDVVLLDNVMPGEPGLDSLVRLREVAPTATVIFQTVDAEMAASYEGHPRGPDGFVEKGLAPSQLTSRIFAIVRRHKEGVVST